jgi:hypothetical protein
MHIFAEDHQFIWLLLRMKDVNDCLTPLMCQDTNLKGNEPDAFQCVSNEKKILERRERSDVKSNIQERYAYEAFIGIKCSHKDLPVIYLKQCERC